MSTRMSWLRVLVIRRCLQIYCIGSAITLVYLIISGPNTIREEKNKKRNLPKASQLIYTRVPYSSIYIFSVIGINSTDEEMWNIFTVNAWTYQLVSSNAIYCCFLYQNGSIQMDKISSINQRTDMFNYTAQIECKNPNPQTTYLISGVSLTLRNQCPDESRTFVRPDLAMKSGENYSMAVCAKIAYGNLNPDLTIEWVEYNKGMGVAHVLAYTFNLSKKAQSVLKYYEDSKYLELRNFDYPRADNPVRYVGDKNTAAWNDEQVVVYDCQARLSGYDFVAVLDFDEFLVPLKDKNFQRMLKRLMRLVPEAGAIDFFGEVYVTDWGPTDRDGEAHVTQYLNRTTSHKPIQINQRKVIHIPARTQRGSVVTHGCKVKKGYKIWKDPVAILGMNHYRSCVDFWKDCFTRNRTTDNRIVKRFVDLISPVRQIKSNLLYQKDETK